MEGEVKNMKFKNQILNRLFGDGSENMDAEDALQAERERMTGASGPAEKEIRPELPPLVPGEMEFTGKEAVNQLYALWTGAPEAPSVFRLKLTGAEELEFIDPKQESGRIEKEISITAKARLKEAVPEEPKISAGVKEPEDAEKPEDDEETEDTAAGEAAGYKGNVESEGAAENEEAAESEGAAESEETAEDSAVNLDALPIVFVSSNKLAAWLMVFPPVGEGRAADRELLEDALLEKGVAFGTEEFLESLPEEKDCYFRLILAAKGQPAADGKDGYIEDFFSRKEKRELEMDASGRIDYTSLNTIQNAEEGQVICQAVPPSEGVPGRNVLNQELPAKDGKAAVLPKGRNTEISEDGSRLLASRAGRVEFSGRSFNVKYSMNISGNVDYSTGNINFLGDVNISGDVRSGFSVRSVGDITVKGVVEASNVEAGRDLRVANGILGDADTVVRSHHNIYAKFLRNSIVHVRGNLYADSLINCEVYCDGEVHISSGRGTIIGGVIRAAHSVNAKIIGSRSESPTAVFLGSHPFMDFEKDFILRKIEDMENELEQLERQPDSPVKAQRMSKLRLDLSVGKMKLGQFDKDLEKEKKKMENEGMEKCRLKCDLAYPGMSLTIGKETLQLTQETSMCNGRLVAGEICLL